MDEEIFKIHHKDARLLDNVIKDVLVDVTITSPPYFDLKDYWYDEQIGYWQNYKEYIDDLSEVFKKVFEVTKDSWTLWLIIDMFKRNWEVVPLPFDISNSISKLWWKLQDVIIWKKDKTVPWAHSWQMRNIFEYVLVFSKWSNFKYNINSIKDTVDLKKRWVKYPERYNPNWKTPDWIWEFPIPMQGSWWAWKWHKHFCPLPPELVKRILMLTTNKDDIVLDPFAWTWTVPIEAYKIWRKYIWFELNVNYIDKFKKYFEKTTNSIEEQFDKKSINSKKQFSTLITNLRINKFASLILKRFKGKVENIVVEIINNAKQLNKHKIIKVRYHISWINLSPIDKEEIILFTKIPPLSKFWIDSELNFFEDSNLIIELIKLQKYYIFPSTKFYFNNDLYINTKEQYTKIANNTILSPFSIKISEKDFE